MKTRTKCVAILSAVVLFGVTQPAFATTTRVWEPVNVAGAGPDTMADGSVVTVSFGTDGRYDAGFSAVAGGDPFFYITGSCAINTTGGCGAATTNGTVRFTFDTARTRVKIHYGFLESFDPERVVVGTSDAPSGTPVDFTATGVTVSSTQVTFTDQGSSNYHVAEGTYGNDGVISTTAPSDRGASGSVELFFASGITWLEFQNDWGGEPSSYENYGQNLVGLSVPVEYAEVTFDANDGDGTMTPQSLARPTALSSNSFTRSGFRFVGWNTQADGQGTSYADGEIFPFEADTTLFAQWVSDSGSAERNTTRVSRTESDQSTPEEPAAEQTLANTGTPGQGALFLGLLAASFGSALLVGRKLLGTPQR